MTSLDGNSSESRWGFVISIEEQKQPDLRWWPAVPFCTHRALNEYDSCQLLTFGYDYQDNIPNLDPFGCQRYGNVVVKKDFFSVVKLDGQFYKYFTATYTSCWICKTHSVLVKKVWIHSTSKYGGGGWWFYYIFMLVGLGDMAIYFINVFILWQSILLPFCFQFPINIFKFCSRTTKDTKRHHTCCGVPCSIGIHTQ